MSADLLTIYDLPEAKDAIWAQRKKVIAGGNWNALDDTWTSRVLRGHTKLQSVSLDIVMQTEEVLREVTDWVTAWDRRNLVILGPIGTGKTTLAIAATREAFMAGAGETLFVTASDLIDGSSYRQRAETVPLLIVDEVGREDTDGFAQKRWFELVDARYSNDLPIVMTTNLVDEDELVAQMGDAVVDRLLEL